MQRVLKFRQWIGGRFYVWGVGIDGNTFVGPASGGGETAASTPHQQFTGLLDKNGKEIYEGDVVKRIGFGVTRGSIEYFMASFMLKATSTDRLHGLEFGDLEIIGNIYENPELMEAPCNATK